MRKERGFTLIELLIVLAILGILIGIVAMSVGNLTDTATARAQSSELEIVQTAYDTFMTQDVLVDGATEPARLEVNAAIVAIGDTDTGEDANGDGFDKYLRRDTKYEYWWDGDGIYASAVVTS